MEDALGKSTTRVTDTASHVEGLHVLKGIWDFFVDRSLDILKFALDGKGFVLFLADHEQIDAPVLSYDRLADIDLSVDLNTPISEDLQNMFGY